MGALDDIEPAPDVSRVFSGLVADHAVPTPIAPAEPRRIQDLQDLPEEAVTGGGMTAMLSSHGYPIAVPNDRVEEAVSKGFTFEDPQRNARRAAEQQAAEGSDLAAFGHSALNAASFGLYNAARSIPTADDQRGGRSFVEAQQDARDAVTDERDTHRGATIAGDIAGLLAPVGAGGLISKAGAAIGERVGASALVDGLAGGGFLSRAAARALPAIARGSAEGGLMGLGEGVSDVALSKDPLTAEAVIGGLANHVALGMAIGGAAGAGVEGLGATLSAAKRAAGNIASSTMERLTAETGAKELAPEVRQALESPAVQTADGTGLRAMRKAEEAQLAAVRVEQNKAVAQDIRSYVQAADETTGELFGTIPKGTPGIGPVRRNLRSATRSAQSASYVESTLEADPGRALKALEFQGQAFKEAQQFVPQGMLDDVITKNQAMRDRVAAIAGDVKSPLLEAIDERLAQLAEPVSDKLVKKGVGMVVGGALGHLSGIPGAGWIGSAAGQMLADPAINWVTKKIMGRFAESATALSDGAKGLLTKLPSPAPAMSAISDLAESAGTALGGKSAFQRATTAITDAVANLPATRGAIHENLAGLRAAQPKLADQVEAGLITKLQFLASKVPKATTGMTSMLMGAAKTIDPSDTQKATFARYVAAANDPLRLLKEMRAEQVMPETIETHKALYPETLNRLRQNIIEALTDSSYASKLSYAMRQQLARVCEAPTDPTLEPQFIASMQAPFAEVRQSKADTTSTPDPTQAQRLAGE